MAFKKYAIEDLAEGKLQLGITASDTTIELESGQGANFPASNFILRLVQFTTTGDPTTTVVQSEKVLCTAKSTDQLTVTRGFDGSTALDFDAGDNVYLTVASAVIEDIQDEVTRLEDDKLDITAFNTSLRTSLGNWKLIYTNGSGEEVELGLGADGEALLSNGPSAIPSRQSPTVNIGGLTEVTTASLDNKAVIETNDGNKAIELQNLTDGLRSASTADKGVVEKATDAEAETGTDTDRYITPKHLKNERDSFGVIQIYGTDYTLAQDLPEVNGTTTMSKLKQITIDSNGQNGKFTISFTADHANASGDSTYSLRINGTEVKTASFTDLISVSHNAVLSDSDTVEIWGQGDFNAIRISDFKIRYSTKFAFTDNLGATVNTV